MLDALAFATPAGAWAFAAVAAVAALYLFHRRHRPQRATGLFLWGAPRRESAGGRTRESLIRSRAFWLDLAAAVLLATALTAPQWASRSRTSVILLDNALGMQSNDNHREAVRTAAGAIAASRQAAVVLAGATPRIAKALAPASGREFADWLEANYAPAEARGDLSRAAAFAKEVYGNTVDIHIITNQSGAERFAVPGTTVHTLAGQGGNLAYRHIWRRGRENARAETLFLGVENFGGETDAFLSVSSGESGAEVFAQGLRLPAGTTAVEIPVAAEYEEDALRIALSADQDSITVDSLAEVLPAAPGRPSVAVRDLPAAARRAAETAFRAAGCVIADDATAAELLVTGSTGDIGNATAEGRVATLRFIGENSPAIARPPFRIDTAKALTRDLDLSDVLWTVAAREHRPRPEEIFIEVGDLPLYWRESKNTFVLNLLPAHGNFTRAPAWPILLANLSASVESLRPESRPFTDGLPLYGAASDARALSPRAATTQGEARDAESAGAMDLRWPLFLFAAALLAINYRHKHAPSSCANKHVSIRRGRAAYE